MPLPTSHIAYIRWFAELGLGDIPLVGGKNASLGEMYSALSAAGVRVPPGFAITADAYREFLHEAQLDQKITNVLQDLDTHDIADLRQRGRQVRQAMIASVIQTAKAKGCKIGICGQAPSDYPEFAQFLVEQGLDSISLNPDAVLKTLVAIAAIEQPRACNGRSRS